MTSWSHPINGYSTIFEPGLFDPGIVLSQLTAFHLHWVNTLQHGCQWPTGVGLAGLLRSKRLQPAPGRYLAAVHVAAYFRHTQPLPPDRLSDRQRRTRGESPALLARQLEVDRWTDPSTKASKRLDHLTHDLVRDFGYLLDAATRRSVATRIRLTVSSAHAWRRAAGNSCVLPLSGLPRHVAEHFAAPPDHRKWFVS